MKKHKNLLICLGIILALALSIFMLSKPTHETNLEDYLRGHGQFDVWARNFFPPEETFTQAENVSYEYFRQRFPHSFRGAFLNLSYDASTYATEKANLETAYAYFPEHDRAPGYLLHYITTAHTTGEERFTLNGYDFRITDQSVLPDYSDEYIALVACNDETYSICYLFFYEDEAGTSSISIDYLVDGSPLDGPWKKEGGNFPRPTS